MIKTRRTIGFAILTDVVRFSAQRSHLSLLVAPITLSLVFPPNAVVAFLSAVLLVSFIVRCADLDKGGPQVENQAGNSRNREGIILPES